MSAGPQIEIASQTWLAVEAWANKVVDDAHKALEQPGNEERHRGRIDAAREVLALAAPTGPKVAPRDVGYDDR